MDFIFEFLQKKIIYISTGFYSHKLFKYNKYKSTSLESWCLMTFLNNVYPWTFYIFFSFVDKTKLDTANINCAFTETDPAEILIFSACLRVNIARE